MSTEMNLTREEELARLIAEQEKDALYGDRITYSPALSLDAPLSHDAEAGTWADIVGAVDVELEELIGGEATAIRMVRTRGVTRDQVASWRWARFRRKWTYRQIAEHFGTPLQTVYYHVNKPWRRGSEPMEFLESKLEIAKGVYARGARLIDVAHGMYEEAGYASPESCYQGLRFLFVIHGVARRPGRWKHGLRSQAASIEDGRRYRNEKNALLRQQGLTCTRKPIRPCPKTTRHGRRCRRLAIDGSDFCVVHALPHPTKKWDQERVIAAMQSWEAKHGVGPKTGDWVKAADDHPAFGTVYALFESWGNALDAACVRQATSKLTRSGDGRFQGLAA